MRNLSLPVSHAFIYILLCRYVWFSATFSGVSCTAGDDTRKGSANIKTFSLNVLDTSHSTPIVVSSKSRQYTYLWHLHHSCCRYHIDTMLRDSQSAPAANVEGSSNAAMNRNKHHGRNTPVGTITYKAYRSAQQYREKMIGYTGHYSHVTCAATMMATRTSR